SVTGDPEQTAANVALVRTILGEVQRKNITAEELQTAKSKIGSRVVRAGERPMGRFQAIGMTWTYLRQYRSIDDDLKSFDAGTLDSIREVLDEYPIDRLTTLALGPLKELA